MNVKISIELPERQVEFVEQLVRDGNYASVSEITQEHVRDLMLAQHEKPADDDPVLARKDEIRRRLQLPDDQWITMDENDTMFDDLKHYADEKIKAGR